MSNPIKDNTQSSTEDGNLAISDDNSKAYTSILHAFEVTIEERPMNYDNIIDFYGELELPEDVTSAQLEKLYSICFRILGIEAEDFLQRIQEDMEPWQARGLKEFTIVQIEQTMYYEEAPKCEFTDESIKRLLEMERGQPIPMELEVIDLPPRAEPNIPWDQETAQKRIRPYLLYIEEELGNNSIAHLALCWNVLYHQFYHGYPVFKLVISHWMKELDARAIGMPGTVEAITLAHDLDTKLQNEKAISWSVCKLDIFPLLNHAHPMVAGGAACYLGWLFANNEFESEPEAPKLIDILEMLRIQKGFREVVCGGFVNGFQSVNCDGLSSLIANGLAQKVKFDLDQWVIDILGNETLAFELQNIQPMWFYIHEHYYYDPDMPMRFIDMDRVALMCATEMNERIDRMKPVLERLVQDPDEVISAHAKGHLERYY